MKSLGEISDIIGWDSSDRNTTILSQIYWVLLDQFLHLNIHIILSLSIHIVNTPSVNLNLNTPSVFSSFFRSSISPWFLTLRVCPLLVSHFLTLISLLTTKGPFMWNNGSIHLRKKRGKKGESERRKKRDHSSRHLHGDISDLDLDHRSPIYHILLLHSLLPYLSLSFFTTTDLARLSVA